MVELPADTNAVHSEDRELIARPALPAYALQELFHSKIPISRVMGVKVEDYGGERLTLSAPLAENINHLGTAFGGSLNALAVLAGYGLLWLELSDTECHVVIRRSSISYDRPVGGALVRATCSSPGKEILSEFKRSFQQKGKARVTLSAHIENSTGEVAVRFEGTYVALREG